VPRRPDADILLAHVPTGGSIGNQRLRTSLGWEEDRYEKVRDALVEDGLLVKGRGRGGSLQRAAPAARTSAKPTVAGAHPTKTKARMPKSTKSVVRVAESATAYAARPAPKSSTGFTGWTAPAQRDANNATMERQLWDAADELRANSDLKSSQYSTPVLGLVFLRFADVRFQAKRRELAAEGASSRRGSRVEQAGAYHAAGVIFLPETARWEHLLTLPEGAGAGKAVNTAMKLIEDANPQLAGALPRSYELFDGLLLKNLLRKLSEIPADLGFDAFGRIYEYFLGEFAMSEGQGGGEFYTPSSIVRLLVEVLEPFGGSILDPACGSGGMFVQSAQFVAHHHRMQPQAAGKPHAAPLRIHGQEKESATAALCRMNLAMHGLEGDIKQAITYYDDAHRSTGRFDYVLANPPFNVDNIDKTRLAGGVGKPGDRFPFGVPTVDNGNYLWISLFASALNARGRAGFVMANSASDARGSELAIRQQLIRDSYVDVMVAVGPNMFYTVTLPVTLWFFDRGRRGTPRADRVLFIDARQIFRQIDRAHRDWTEAQIGFLSAIVRLYRGESVKDVVGGDETQAKLREFFHPGIAGVSLARDVDHQNPAGETPAIPGGSFIYRDVPGLCKAATLVEIEAQGWSLNPGRYVGTSPEADTDNDDFLTTFNALTGEFSRLSEEAKALEQRIGKNSAFIAKAD